jgi:undecaprenyl pyrophosphate phosphatase UppP
MRRRRGKAFWLPLCLALYATVVAALYLPRQTEVPLQEKLITFVVSYVVIGLLWWVLRLQEKRRREEEEK